MPRPSFRRVVGILARWLAFSAVVTGLLALAPLFSNGFGQGFWTDMMHLGMLGVIGGFCGAGLVYLAHAAKSMRALHLAQSQMRLTEAVMKETHANHCQTVSPLRLRIAIGGKLYLTTSKLVFKAHAGQPGTKEIVVPLMEIVEARGTRNILGLANRLVIKKADGSQEMFGFAVGSPMAEWASAIMVLRGMGPAIEGRVDHGDTNLPSPNAPISADIKTEGPSDFAERPPE
jgi:hypothetical protein